MPDKMNTLDNVIEQEHGEKKHKCTEMHTYAGCGSDPRPAQ